MILKYGTKSLDEKSSQIIESLVAKVYLELIPTLHIMVVVGQSLGKLKIGGYAY